MERIDIGEIIATKNPKLANRLPSFIIKAVERLICVEKINFVLENYSHQKPLEFIDSTLRYMNVSYTLHNTDNIPSNKRLIFASNHPLGGLDGIILAKGIGETLQGTNVRLIVNDLLMNVDPLKPLFVPVNKHGSQSPEYASMQKFLYDSDDAIITFPAGLCSRLIGGKITDTPWKKNFVAKAIESERLIVPTYVSGRNSKMFYRIALWRKRLGIKVNLEMILLPREMFVQKAKHFDIYFGKPVTIDTNLASVKEWTEKIRNITYKLEEK